MRRLSAGPLRSPQHLSRLTASSRLQCINSNSMHSLVHSIRHNVAPESRESGNNSRFRDPARSSGQLSDTSEPSLGRFFNPPRLPPSHHPTHKVSPCRRRRRPRHRRLRRRRPVIAVGLGRCVDHALTVIGEAFGGGAQVGGGWVRRVSADCCFEAHRRDFDPQHPRAPRSRFSEVGEVEE